jgi:hypothetical protein
LGRAAPIVILFIIGKVPALYWKRPAGFGHQRGGPKGARDNILNIPP